MSEINIVKGVIPCMKANEDTRVVVDDAFSVLVPKGMMFSTDQSEIGRDKLLAMFSPVPNLVELEDDSFDMQYFNSQTRICFNVEFHELGGVLDLSDAETRKNLEKTLLKVLRDASDPFKNLIGEDLKPPFVVRSDEKAVVVAASQGILGNASFILAFPSGYYTGMYRVAKGTDMEDMMENATPAVYKKTAKKFLSTIETIEDSSATTSDNGESMPLLVSELSYTQNRRIAVGTISVLIPDGTKCALCKATDEIAAEMPYDLKNKMDFICVPEVYTRGFSAYQDASISIFLGKPMLVDNLEHDWNSNSIDDTTSQLIAKFESSINKQAITKPFKIAHKEKGFMSCYCLFSGENSQEDFWRSYVFFIVNGGISISGMFYFNQKATESKFDAIVKHWLSEVRHESSEITKKAMDELVKVQLGPYAAENGKLDAILVARLFAEDVLFFPETQFERVGNELKLINPQFNIAKQEDHPFIMQNRQTLLPSLGDFFVQLDKNKELQLPKSKLHKKLLKLLLDDRLTGLSFLNLIAYHMVKIIENDDEKNTYFVIVDQNVIAGIPDVYHYICKFIKFARDYNEKSGAFAVQFLSSVNFDGPISGKLTPVAGAAVGQAVGGVCGFMVQEDGTITDGATMTVNNDEDSVDIHLETKQQTQEEKMTVAQLEAKLDEDVINGLKRYTKEALAIYKKIPDELATKSFNRLRSTEKVIERIMDILYNSLLDCSDYCIYSTLEVSYRKNFVRFESGWSTGLTYDIRIQYENSKAGDGSFNPNQIPNDLISVVEQLTENEIYYSLLVNAVTAQNQGEVLVAPDSPRDVICTLKQYDEIEISGTQYEGRSDRIEYVNVGDKLKLVREPNNAYDKNAIDVQNSSGSLGHIPSYITGQLSPLIDLGLVKCTATVSEVLPLSKRSGRARKAILKVRLDYTLVQKTEKSTSTKSTKKQRSRKTSKH